MSEITDNIFQMTKKMFWFSEFRPAQEQLFNKISLGKGKNITIQETWCRWAGKTTSINLLAAYFAMTGQNEDIRISMRRTDIKSSMKQVCEILTMDINSVKSEQLLTIGSNRIIWLTSDDQIRGHCPTVLLVDDFTGDRYLEENILPLKKTIKLYLVLSYTKQFEIDEDMPEPKVTEGDFLSESHAIVMKNYGTKIGDVLKSEVEYTEIK